MKPLPRKPRSTTSRDSVVFLLGRLEQLCETFGMDALADDSLAPVATALADAADVAGRWLVDNAPEIAAVVALAMQPQKQVEADAHLSTSCKMRVGAGPSLTTVVSESVTANASQSDLTYATDLFGNVAHPASPGGRHVGKPEQPVDNLAHN